MPLVLTTLRVPPGAGPQRHEVIRNSVSIGRGAECDWVLPDAGRILSKIHCLLAQQGGRWFVTDMSSNGTQLEGQLLDPGVPRRVRSGARLTLGAYEIEIQIQAQAGSGDGVGAQEPPSWPSQPQDEALSSEPGLETIVRRARDRSATGAHAVSDEALAAAFSVIATAAGIKAAPQPAPDEALREVGRALRAAVVEIRRGISALGTAWGEVLMSRTTRGTAADNPLIMARNDDDALSALLGAGRTNGMLASRAVTEALRDLRRHDLAVIRAMRRAVEEMLAHLAPDQILAGLRPSAIDVVPGARHQRGFRAYEKLHARMIDNLSGGAEAVFDRAFVRAYEAALAELAAAEGHTGGDAPTPGSEPGAQTLQR